MTIEIYTTAVSAAIRIRGLKHRRAVPVEQAHFFQAPRQDVAPRLRQLDQAHAYSVAVDPTPLAQRRHDGTCRQGRWLVLQEAVLCVRQARAEVS